MAINFPDTPTVGLQHAEGGKIWTYDGEKWGAVTASLASNGFDTVVASGTISSVTSSSASYVINASAGTNFALSVVEALPNSYFEVSTLDAMSPTILATVSALPPGTLTTASFPTLTETYVGQFTGRLYSSPTVDSITFETNGITGPTTSQSLIETTDPDISLSFSYFTHQITTSLTDLHLLVSNNTKLLINDVEYDFESYSASSSIISIKTANSSSAAFSNGMSVKIIDVSGTVVTGNRIQGDSISFGFDGDEGFIFESDESIVRIGRDLNAYEDSHVSDFEIYNSASAGTSWPSAALTAYSPAGGNSELTFRRSLGLRSEDGTLYDTDLGDTIGRIYFRGVTNGEWSTFPQSSIRGKQGHLALFTPTADLQLGQVNTSACATFETYISNEGGAVYNVLFMDESQTYLEMNGAQTLNITPSTSLINNLAASYANLTSPIEIVGISSASATGTVAFDVETSAVKYYSGNAAANFTLNFRKSSTETLSSMLAVGESISLVFLCTNGATAYYPTAFQIDGNAVTPKWSGGSAPSSGNASSIDAYSFTIIKTAATPTYLVLAGAVKFA